MPAIYQYPFLKVRGNAEFFQELANGRSRTRVQVKLFLACGGVFGQVGKKMDTDGHKMGNLLSDWVKARRGTKPRAPTV